MKTSALTYLLVSAWMVSGLAAPIDLRYAPTPSERQAAAEQGWQTTRDLLAEALCQSYRPGIGGRAGSTGMTSHRQWLTLWRWSDLLARTEHKEAVSFLRRFLFDSPDSDRAVLMPPGRGPEPGMTPVSEAFIENLLADSRARAELLGKFLPPNIPDPSDRTIAERLNPELLAAWVADSEFSDLLFSAISEDDYLPGVLWILQEIALAHPENFKKYPALALAIAIVYDARPPDFWPHRQVDQAHVPIAEISPPAWFAQWVEASESKTLLSDLGKMPPSQLKFVVDAPLSATEFAWGRKNARFPRGNFERAFSAVNYRDDRLETRTYSWDDGDYTLENILAKGGICVDQAYFAMIAGKARGLPTLFFTGQGADGGHAWFGFLKNADRWDMDAGRYENQNYAVGEALDPQNWMPISDHDLKGLAEGFRDKAPYAASRDDLILAALLEKAGNQDLAARAYRSAVEVCPDNPEAWDENGQFLLRSGASPTERKALHEAALKQFANRRDLRVRHQLALAGIAREEGDALAADAIERKILAQNRRLRSDLSVSAAARRLMLLVDDAKFKDAMSEYASMLRALSQTGGGNFFHDVVAPFAELLDEEGDTASALEAVAMARKSLRPSKDSILDQSFDKLEAKLKE